MAHLSEHQQRSLLRSLDLTFEAIEEAIRHAEHGFEALDIERIKRFVASGRRELEEVVNG